MASKLDVAVRKTRDLGDVIHPIYKTTNLCGRKSAGGSLWRTFGYLRNSEVPVRLNALLERYQRQGDLPVLDRRRVWIEWCYLQFYRVEFINGYGGFRVRVEVFIELFEDRID